MAEAAAVLVAAKPPGWLGGLQAFLAQERLEVRRAEADDAHLQLGEALWNLRQCISLTPTSYVLHRNTTVSNALKPPLSSASFENGHQKNQEPEAHHRLQGLIQGGCGNTTPAIGTLSIKYCATQTPDLDPGQGPWHLRQPIAQLHRR